MSRVERALTDRVEQRWARWVRQAPRAAEGRLAAQAESASRLRHHLSELITTHERRRETPGAAGIARPAGCDWAWRPALWASRLPEPGRAGVSSRQALGEEVTLFHDCPLGEVILRQVPGRADGEGAPHALSMEVFAFEGSFLSLVLELPAEAGQGLGKRHLVRLRLVTEAERPVEVFARLNVRHGPNTEQIVREIPPGSGTAEVEFDLGYSRLNEKLIERLWLDLIFDRPAMNRVLLRDVTLLRHPRAEL
ncbi:DUF6478 family protein [Pseudoroseicyclus tamaricis]|nr:DUF6478 family protein [Pseudoroseicyclus tamaricis]